jgi:hypothetical protein
VPPSNHTHDNLSARWMLKQWTLKHDPLFIYTLYGPTKTKSIGNYVSICIW